MNLKPGSSLFCFIFKGIVSYVSNKTGYLVYKYMWWGAHKDQKTLSSKAWILTWFVEASLHCTCSLHSVSHVLDAQEFFSLMCLLTVKEKTFWTFPEVLRLRFCASNAWDSGLIPGWNKIPHVWQGGQKKKEPFPFRVKRDCCHTGWFLSCQGTDGDSWELNWVSSVVASHTAASASSSHYATGCLF